MKVLVYGAGPLGSVFAAKMAQGGHEVSILARGERLAQIKEHGIVLVDVQAEERSVTPVRAVEALAPEDAYDLVMVIMRKNHALEILPVLAANKHTPNVLFLMNNAAGPEALVAALGAERVLTGFPSSAGFRQGHEVHCLTGSPGEEMSVPIGEVDGRITERLSDVAAAINCMPGLQAEMRTDMDAWSKYHVALLMPSLAPALYAADMDNYRLARTRDAIVLSIRAIREGFRVLRALGLPLTPQALWPFAWLPEPLLVYLYQKRLGTERMEVAIARHAEAARDEIRWLVDEFLELADESGVAIPNIHRLYPYLDADQEPIPDGSAQLPLDWRGVWAAAGAALGAIVLVGALLGRFRRTA